MLASPICHESTRGKQNSIVVRVWTNHFHCMWHGCMRVACGLLHYPRKLWTKKLVLEKECCAASPPGHLDFSGPTRLKKFCSQFKLPIPTTLPLSWISPSLFMFFKSPTLKTSLGFSSLFREHVADPKNSRGISKKWITHKQRAFPFPESPCHFIFPVIPTT